jgi:hypothetical protein
MSKFDLKDKLDGAIYRAYNLMADILFHVNFSKKKLVKKNLVYKNKHKGERCFILGTGPSLNLLSKEQVDALCKEVVFGANSLYKVETVSRIFPKYYTLIDNLYWESWSHTFKAVTDRYIERPPVFITDPRAVAFAENANLAHQHIFICSKKYPVTEMSENLESNIYAAMNVVSYSILTAIYMGFSEIYLLGCDYNAFCTGGKGHAYDDKDELKQANYNLAFYLKFYWITTEFHYLVAKLAKKRGVTVANLTTNSLLDAYPKIHINTIFNPASQK